MIYGKPAKSLVIDLINEANPDLPFPINDTDFKIADVTAKTPDENGHNTTCRVIAKANSGYTGSVVVSYRRIDTQKLFNSSWPIIKKFHQQTDSVSTDDLLAQLSQQTGILFEPGLWASYALLPTTGAIYSDMLNNGTVYYNRIDPVASNPAYTGVMEMGYTLGKKDLSEMFVLTDVAEALSFTMGTDPTSHPQAHLAYDMFNKDFSDEEPVADGYALRYWFTHNYGTVTETEFNGASASIVTGKQQYWRDYLIPKINQIAGTNLTIPARSDVDMDVNPQDCGDNELIGWSGMSVDLPHADYPEANTKQFNALYIIELHENCPWATGKLYLHYNKD